MGEHTLLFSDEGATCSASKTVMAGTTLARCGSWHWAPSVGWGVVRLWQWRLVSGLSSSPPRSASWWSLIASGLGSQVGGRTSGVGYDWSFGLERLGTVVVLLTLLIQQVSTCRGNLVQVYRFLSIHHATNCWRVSRWADTLFGSFPFRIDDAASAQGSNTLCLVSYFS